MRNNTVCALFVPVAMMMGCTPEPGQLPPVGHHVIHVDTDAILPPAVGEARDPNGAPALFDRLEITVLADGEAACPECTRVFPVDVSSFIDRGASLTVVPPTGSRLMARARLFRAEAVVEGTLRSETAIEVVAQLPRTPAEGGVETTLVLRTEDVGVPRGTVESPLALGGDDRVQAGPVERSRVGSWPLAVRQPCTETSADGQVCVPGGAYWMGNPLVQGNGFTESDRQRLVVLSPFYIDAKEVTVAEFRSWAESTTTAIDVTSYDPDPSTEEHFCTYRDTPDDALDERPLNCVGWETAQAYCTSRGMTLPSEAQFEYASGALRSALFIWGQDELAVCAGAVWGRGGREATVIETLSADQCLPEDPFLDGPLALPTDVEGQNATRLTDRLAVADGLVFDLAGNLQEWVLDDYNGQNDACWLKANTNVFIDPVCADPGTTLDHAVRGGSWAQDRAFLRAAYRTVRAPESGERFRVGFRCVMADPAPRE